MTHSPQDHKRGTKRSFLIFCLSLVCTMAAAGCALYAYYATPYSFAVFFLLASVIFVMHGLATISMIAALPFKYPMQMSLQWAIMRATVFIVVAGCASLGMWTDNGLLIAMIIACGVLDLFLFITSR